MYHIAKYIVSIPILFSMLCLPASISNAEHKALIRWNVGKILVFSGGVYSFQSTGFLFRSNGKHFVITTNHTIKNIERAFGSDYKILVQFPNLDKPLACTLLFSEPSEDSAVLQIEFPDIEKLPQPDYEQSINMTEGYHLIMIGYSDTTYKQHNPIMLPVYFLTKAALNFESSRLMLPPLLSDSNVFLTKGGSPHLGMSGGPVVEEDTLTLLGMTKSYGISRKDKGITEMLGVDEFHIVVRLDKTIQKIKNIR